MDLYYKIVLGSSNTLEELNYGWRYDQDFPSLHGTIFLKLNKLVINHGPRQTPFPTVLVLQRIGQALMESFPALQYLNVHGVHLYEISKMAALQNLPR